MNEGSCMLTALEELNANSVTITRKAYKELLADSEELRLLHAGGVDNWEWYSACFENEDEEE